MLKLTAGWKKGAGRNRDYYAIKKWMDENAVSGKQIALDVGVHRVLVSQVLRGISNHRGILRRFLGLGCPADILSLPDDMKADANAENKN